MPLRDHFGPPLDQIASWERSCTASGRRSSFSSCGSSYPRLRCRPASAFGVPDRNRRGDVRKGRLALCPAHPGGNGGVATAIWAPPQPSVAVETALPDFDEYEVRIYDAARGRRPGRGHRAGQSGQQGSPRHRNLFVAKCAALLQRASQSAHRPRDRAPFQLVRRATDADRALRPDARRPAAVSVRRLVPAGANVGSGWPRFDRRYQGSKMGAFPPFAPAARGGVQTRRRVGERRVGVPDQRQ